MELRRKDSNLLITVFVLILVLGCAYLLSRLNYLLFHSTVEIFSIVIASMAFILTWHSSKRDQSQHFMLLGVGYLFVGILDFLHTMSFQGMKIVESEIFFANQLWICARFMESATLLIFCILLPFKITINRVLVFGFYLLVTILIIVSVFYLQIFPTCFILGQGQTLFKILSEYIVCIILIIALIFLIRNKKSINSRLVNYIIASIISTILSELSFTLYTDNFGVMNLIGHILKVCSFYFIFRSIVLVSLEEPFNLEHSDLQVQLAKIARLNHELENKEKELEAILDHIPGLVFYKDKNNNFIRVNKMTAQAYGKDKSELQNVSLEQMHEKIVADKFYQDDLSVISSGIPAMNIEETLETSEGIKWLDTCKIPFKNVDGEIIGVIGISIDITEKKKSEIKIKNLLAEKELILKEVHHRIKNNFMTVNGILYLQAEKVNSPEAKTLLLEAADRVLSMATLYDKLYRNENVNQVSLKDFLPPLISLILSHFTFHEHVKVEYQIDDLILDAKPAQNLVIILNELITNTMKYAFVGRLKGLIMIAAHRMGSRVRVMISDDGIGIPDQIDFSKSSGFGLQMVNIMCQEINGIITIQRANGTQITLEFEPQGRPI